MEINNLTITLIGSERDISISIEPEDSISLEVYAHGEAYNTKSITVKELAKALIDDKATSLADLILQKQIAYLNKRLSEAIKANEVLERQLTEAKNAISSFKEVMKLVKVS